MRRLIRLVPLLLVTAAAACDIFGTDEPNLVFDSQRIVISDTDQSSATALAGNNIFSIDGVMIAPNDCQNLRASVQRGSGTITVTITARQATTTCETTRGGYGYRVASSMTEGVYQLRVIHNFSGAQPPETVLDTQITVT